MRLWQGTYRVALLALAFALAVPGVALAAEPLPTGEPVRATVTHTVWALPDDPARPTRSPARP